MQINKNASKQNQETVTYLLQYVACLNYLTLCISAQKLFTLWLIISAIYHT